MSDALPRLKDNDSVVAPQTGKTTRSFSRFWDAAMRAIERKLEEIAAGPGIVITNPDGVGGNPKIYRLGPDNFGFFVGGLMTAGELLGSGVYDADVLFPSVLKPPVVVSEFPATASAVFNIKSLTGGVETTRGTITFDAGGTTGTVAWSGGSYLLTSGDRLKLYAPASADITLSKVTGLVPGDLS